MCVKKIRLILILIVLIIEIFSIPDTYANEVNNQLEIGELIKNGTWNEAFMKMEMMKNRTIQTILLGCMVENNLHQFHKIIMRYDFLQSKITEFQETTFNDSLKYYTSALDSFKQSIIKNYPQYAYFLMAQAPMTIDKIQHDYLHENQALLDFWLQDDQINVFIVTKDNFSVEIYDVNQEYLSKILIKLMTPLYRAKNPLHLFFDLDLAHQLYKQLFEPLEIHLKNIHSLIIIPDDELLGFPFELLVTKINPPRRKKKDVLYEKFTEVNFLIHKYAIAYNFSAVGLDHEFQAVRNKKKLGRELLTMSEITGLSNEKDTTAIDGNLLPLVFGKEEVYRVSRWLWRHKNLTGEFATADFLKNDSFDFRWIYLAIPGILNNENPNSSFLLFSKSSDYLSDNRLRISDIMNCKLRADLITVSGCELKPVDIRKKVGILGIPQSFLVSGVESVMFSLWRINAIITSRFMSKFYWELKYKRQTNIMALQQAKLSSIKDTFEFNGKEISRAHPYFWASFVLIGNVDIRPPTFSTIPPRMVILMMYIIVLAVSLLIVRKTINKTVNKANSINKLSE